MHYVVKICISSDLKFELSTLKFNYVNLIDLIVLDESTKLEDCIAICSSSISTIHTCEVTNDVMVVERCVYFY